jgi:hypothetical protein
VAHHLDGNIDYTPALFPWGAEMADHSQPGTFWYGARIAAINGNSAELILYKPGFQGGKPILLEDRRITLTFTPTTIYSMFNPHIYEIRKGFWSGGDNWEVHGCLADLTTIPSMAARFHANADGSIIEVLFMR